MRNWDGVLMKGESRHGGGSGKSGKGGSRVIFGIFRGEGRSGGEYGKLRGDWINGKMKRRGRIGV